VTTQPPRRPARDGAARPGAAGSATPRASARGTGGTGGTARGSGAAARGTSGTPRGTGATARGTTQARTGRTGTARTGYASTGTARTGTARTGTARTGTARTGTARTGTARTGTARTGAGRTPPAARRRPARPAPRPTQPRLGRPATRLRAGLAVLVVLLVVFAGRLVQLQGLSREEYSLAAATQRTTTSVLAAERGAITDRNGEPLALSVQARAVFGEPRVIRKAACREGADRVARPCDTASVAAWVAPRLKLPLAEVQAKLERTSAFVYLARGLDVDVAAAFQEQVREARVPGIGVLAEPKRVHPAGDLAVNVVGFMDAEGKQGLAGVESGWHTTLAGTPGRTTSQVDGKGRTIPTAEKTVVAPVAGSDVRLTIDRYLQWYAQDVLAKQVAKTRAESGTVVVMDPRSGDVLAFASAPTFDPDDRKGVTGAMLRNPGLSDPYEPGSVNKIITAAAALEAGIVTPDSVLTVPDSIQVANRRIHDSHPHPVERLTFTGVMVKSSNVGTVQVALKLGPQRVYDALRRWGFGEKSGLGLPGESRGIVPAPKDWSGTSIGTIPIGQGVAATAVQVASVYATVANGGVRATPTIVQATVGPDGKASSVKRAAPKRVISAAVAQQLRTMLEGVVSEEGTAPLAAVPGYRVAGKTGTAQRVVDGRYDGSYTSSFVGFAPADKPRLVVAVVLQAPKGAYYGGTVAGPVFKDVMSFALTSLKVPPTTAPKPVLALDEAALLGRATQAAQKAAVDVAVAPGRSRLPGAATPRR
jgi:cell division protein FtsI (penicillin-binding protein 3)